MWKPRNILQMGMVALVTVGLLGRCGSHATTISLRVFIADSLARPFGDLARAFEAEHPTVDIMLIPSGSVLAARKLTSANDQADVLAVADHMVINRLLRPRYATWSICFATNEVGVLYTDMSTGASELTADNWFDVLSRPDVKVQAANPHHDPCGYWTELCWRLADNHYPVSVGGGTIHDRMMAKCGSARDRRADAQQLLRLVESMGGVDYAFVYRSQALQHNLPFLRLPPQINLGDASLVDTYRRVSIELPGSEPGQHHTKRGDVIVFAITIPTTVEHPREAIDFIQFMLSPKGQAVLVKAHLDVVEQPWTNDFGNVPQPLRPELVEQPYGK